MSVTGTELPSTRHWPSVGMMLDHRRTLIDLHERGPVNKLLSTNGVLMIGQYSTS